MESQLFTKPNAEQIDIAEQFLKENFLSEEEIWENHQSTVNLKYFSKPEAILFLYEDKELVGVEYLFKRYVQLGGLQIYLAKQKERNPILSIGGEPILAGGFGNVCVKRNQRRKGIGKKLIGKGIEILKEWDCDIAYLDANIEKNGPFYNQFGFIPFKGKCIFYNSRGKRMKAQGPMIAPISSNAIFKKVLKSKKSLYLGNGNW